MTCAPHVVDRADVKRARRSRLARYRHAKPPRGDMYTGPQHPNGKQRVRHGEQVSTEIGDVLTFDGNPWVVIAKEPPFERRRIERLICTPPTGLHYRRQSP